MGTPTISLHENRALTWFDHQHGENHRFQGLTVSRQKTCKVCTRRSTNVWLRWSFGENSDRRWIVGNGAKTCLEQIAELSLIVWINASKSSYPFSVSSCAARATRHTFSWTGTRKSQSVSILQQLHEAHHCHATNHESWLASWSWLSFRNVLGAVLGKRQWSITSKVSGWSEPFTWRAPPLYGFKHSLVHVFWRVAEVRGGSLLWREDRVMDITRVQAPNLVLSHRVDASSPRFCVTWQDAANFMTTFWSIWHVTVPST